PTMRYIAAFLLSAMSGQEPTKESVKKILGSVGIDCEEDRLNKLSQAFSPTMRYIAAFLLSAMSGQEPTKESVKKILGSVGIDCEEDRLNK
uniref:Large ribosomal subunit protein P2 n=1 Tax=Macrostomum lignano TaxID=282301 RepID=A0A1I8IPP3_9PLAT